MYGSRLIKIVALVCVTAVAAPAPTWVDAAGRKSCLQHVSEALDALSTGLTNEALESTSAAITMDANEPLAHVTAGAALLFGGRKSEAAQAFSAADELGDPTAEAEYGRALLALSSAELDRAADAFRRASVLDPSTEVTGALAYIKALKGAGYEKVESDTPDECIQALNAAALMRERRFDEALAVWQALQPAAYRTGFGERIGCSMKFLRSAPVALTGWPIKAYKPTIIDRDKLSVVSGRVTLQADLSKSGEADVVSFFVDERFVGMTNHSPFHYVWDTKNVSNGVHTVKIQALYDGHPISEKSTRVMVRNAGSAPQFRETDERAGVRARLRETLRLKPSTAAINYNLALCALKQSDKDAAIAALERVLAADPSYLDAADRLSSIFGNVGLKYERISIIDTSKKQIVLTFDDGPRPGSEQLLDILREKQVAATFFVVGKQAEAHPELIQTMIDDGHDIQSHTYSHRALDLVPESEIVQEIFRTSAVIRSITGRAPRFMRPPGGREGKRLPEVLKRFGVSSVFWTVNCVGAEGTTREQLVSRALSQTAPGGIILMHNYETVTLLALPEIIDRLRSAGYELVTLSQALGT